MRFRIITLALVIASAVSNICFANSYTIKNNSCLEIKVHAWFTHAIQGSHKTAEAYGSTILSVLFNSLPAPDLQLILMPQDVETITEIDDQVQQGECLVCLVAEYKVIPTIAPVISATAGMPADLYIVGKRFWAHKLPGLCGIHTIEMNYDPATQHKFIIKINGVDDYFHDVKFP